jgi:hypothetical protein
MATDDPAPADEEELQREPKASRPWLAMIEDAEHSFKDWQSKADNIDKLYANLTALSGDGRDREFQMFWANIQVLGPSIYARPPVPVVAPRFKDRRPVPRMASELLERCTVVGFELEDIDGVMRLVRDDLTVLARGCAWVRYETKNGQRVCIDFADRKDFVISPARTWKEVDIVAKRSWMTEDEMEKRFKEHSQDAYKNAAFEERKTDDDTRDSKLKAGVWELWCKSKNKVVWVTEGVDVVLDDGEPHLKLEGFFPCPCPAFSTVQRRSLVPVPDFLFYKDQLEEINELTARIGLLADALKVRGFYPAGAGEIGDAIEAAVKNTENNALLIPLSNVMAFTGQAFKDMILWLPIEVIAATIVQLVELRKQLIADVYEITGLSDIMRGATDARETLGAQELKSQYGSVRIRDRQNELVRFARDLVRITAEIMAENFTSKTMLEMSQLEIETDAEIAKQVKGLEDQIRQIVAQVEQAKADPQMVQQAQANPEQAQQMLAQAKQQAEGLKGQIQKLNETPTVEKVMKLLRDQRVRPFVLDIETDSTIAPDENAQKQRATEFITAVGGFMNQALPLVQAVPQSSKLMAETLKYVAGQFRAGRQLEGEIEEFADTMAQVAQKPQAESPEAVKAKVDAEAVKQKAAMDAQAHQRDTEAKAAEQKLRQEEAMANQERAERELAAKMEEKDREEARKIEAHRVDMENKAAERAEKAQLFEQSMRKGALEIEGKQVAIANDQAKTQAALAGEDAKQAGTKIANEGKMLGIEQSEQTHAQTLERGAAEEARAVRAEKREAAMEPA